MNEEDDEPMIDMNNIEDDDDQLLDLENSLKYAKANVYVFVVVIIFILHSISEIYLYFISKKRLYN